MVDYNNPPPVCSLCGHFYVPYKNGVDVFLMIGHDYDEIYKYWRADEYHCPECGVRIITRFGSVTDYHEAPDKIMDIYERAKHEGTAIEVT